MQEAVCDEHLAGTQVLIEVPDVVGLAQKVKRVKIGDLRNKSQSMSNPQVRNFCLQFELNIFNYISLSFYFCELFAQILCKHFDQFDFFFQKFEIFHISHMCMFHILQELVNYYVFKYFSKLFVFQLYNISGYAEIVDQVCSQIYQWVTLYLLNFMAFLARTSPPQYKESSSMFSYSSFIYLFKLYIWKFDVKIMLIYGKYRDLVLFLPI